MDVYQVLPDELQGSGAHWVNVLPTKPRRKGRPHWTKTFGFGNTSSIWNERLDAPHSPSTPAQRRQQCSTEAPHSAENHKIIVVRPGTQQHLHSSSTCPSKSPWRVPQHGDRILNPIKTPDATARWVQSRHCATTLLVVRYAHIIKIPFVNKLRKKSVDDISGLIFNCPRDSWPRLPEVTSCWCHS